MQTNDRFLKRRLHLGHAYSRTLFVVPSGIQAQRSHSVKYRFKPSSEFLYLSGLNLSGAFLVILREKVFLLVDQKNEHVWGEDLVLSPEDKLLLEGITLVPISKLEEIIQSHFDEIDRIAFSFGSNPMVEKLLLTLISYHRTKKQRNSSISLCDARYLIGTARLVKDADEVQSIKRAAFLSSKVHTKLMETCLIGKTERQISNWIEAGFLLEDMQWTAYETIVGSGPRSTLLHARATNRLVKDDDLVLIDAGGEWNGYCSDITRVPPAGKKFTENQKKIYKHVLAVQKATIKSVKPGANLQEIHECAKETLIGGLKSEKILDPSDCECIDSLMSHSTSHWIGMDVHDPSPYVDDSGSPIKLAPGMCFTIEPGLYFRSIEKFSTYCGIGIRIEDDVVVTKTGCELLSEVPKEVEEIEQIRSGLD